MNQNYDENIKKVQEKHPKADPKIIKELLDEKESVEHIIHLFDIDHKSTRYTQPKKQPQQQKQGAYNPPSFRNQRRNRYPKQQSTEQKQQSSDQKQQSTDPKQQSTDPKQQSTDPKQQSTDPKQQSTDPKDNDERKLNQKNQRHSKQQSSPNQKIEPPPRSTIIIEYPKKHSIQPAWSDPRSFFTTDPAFGPKVQTGTPKSSQNTPANSETQNAAPQQQNAQTEQHIVQSPIQSKIQGSPKQLQESPKSTERGPVKQSEVVSLKLPSKLSNVKYNTLNFGAFDSKWQSQSKNSKNSISPVKPVEPEGGKLDAGKFANELPPSSCYPPNSQFPYHSQAVYGTFPYPTEFPFSPPDLSTGEPIPGGYPPPGNPFYIYVQLPPGEVPPNLPPPTGYPDHSDY